MSIENQKNESEFQEKVNALLSAINEPADVENAESPACRRMLYAILEEALSNSDNVQKTHN